MRCYLCSSLALVALEALLAMLLFSAICAASTVVHDAQQPQQTIPPPIDTKFSNMPDSSSSPKRKESALGRFFTLNRVSAMSTNTPIASSGEIDAENYLNRFRNSLNRYLT